ncbi:hypothetical protein FSARC_4469 [Fusarium sarcochroum]|uniref:Xylanolytic transcriptional activator regulatory domain-containing protein n=1 Tax=Fusarium sarcochroum TaxID=1208366 RepID=A0A8H4U243_9HYPO|nr:hypothetical protein FSARC_4469 [Fusarium sarcochroum]
MSVHEPSVRQILNQALGNPPSITPLTDQSFTLLTAVCAKVCCFVPPELFSLGASLADTFLEASRSCFSTYAEADLENPCAESITIRYLHSNCLHTRARSTLSWHIFGEAVRLAQRMRLYDESSYTSLSPVEALLRRCAFWQLYAGDKSLAVLRSMPIVIYDHMFEEGITAAYPSDDTNEFTPGFIANVRLWRCAADLLIQIRLIKSSQNHENGGLLTSAFQQILGRLYVNFATCLDDLPASLIPNNTSRPSEGHATHDKFAALIADLHITYHCLKIHVTTKLDEIGYFTQAAEYKDMLVLRKTEIARDMIKFLQAAPFWSLQVNGEPCAEKIRLVGVSLLAIIQEPSMLTARAHSDFTILLDILSQLDSRASDMLRKEIP